MIHCPVQKPAADVSATPSSLSSDSPTIWGLSVRQLHDAYWRSRGVQCVRRGKDQPLQRAAELYLLLEPDQLVVFNIAHLSERLTWHNAAVTRLRIVDEHERTYSERVVTDERGLVQRIERRYRPQMRGSSRVILASRRRSARLWMTSTDRREGWKRVRGSVRWPRVDHGRSPGLICLMGEPDQEKELLDRLIETWVTPSQCIDGIKEAEPGVWLPEADVAPDEAVRIGPLWLGRGIAGQPRKCLVGPGWLSDASVETEEEVAGASVRPIAQVELAQPSPETGAVLPGRTYALVKRMIDVVASASALTVLLPAMLAIAALVVLEDGFPVFFGHKRQGKAGRPFRCWKFRTMHRNAEQITRELAEYNVCDGPQVFIQDDPRVTRIGRILRATHLDEIPQFFNVLLGQMSLVGPRPSPDDENQYCPAWRDARLSVRPGITGLWQLKRKREAGEDFQEWIRYDLEYIQHSGLLFDLQIMFKTAWMMVKGR